MECYEGATMIKTFRGLMMDGTQDTIVLHTNDGSMGYRIVKFQMIPMDPAADNMESTIKIFKVSQTTFTATIDFSDNTLLLAAYIENHDGTSSGFSNFTNAVIFDKEIFNQDIYVTLKSDTAAATSGVNYYLELEQIKLDLSENTVATLKDIRNLAML